MLKYGRGFTLIEVFLAIFIVTMAIGTSFAVIYRTVSFYPVISGRLIAAYLGQEGIELVRNIRDTNYLEAGTAPVDWDDGIPVGDWEADYTNVALSDTFDGDFLRIDAGFYKYSGAGSITPFQRRITIAKPGPDIIEVSVTIIWLEKGRSHQFSGRENLYNWK